TGGAGILSTPWYIDAGAPARFFCVDTTRGILRFSRDLRTTLIKRVGEMDFLENVLSARYE
ncbi:MAG: hypothetical protein LUO93_07520, partial [Methanomicrobiales archaeon]|nr:hypothetical protein [Methanomicrobiales archaeon]